MHDGVVHDVEQHEKVWASALIRAIADDAATSPPAGAVARAALRWFEAHDPLYFTVHLLGADELNEESSGELAWLPLEWAHSSRELERSERVRSCPSVIEAAEPLLGPYRLQLEQAMANEIAGRPTNDEFGGGISPAVLGAVLGLKQGLVQSSVAITADFAVTAMHFEGYGGLEVLKRANPAGVVDRLCARGELPEP